MGFENLTTNLNLYASDTLAERIRGMISSGELQAGFSFPKEEEFAKQLGVSRSTLREAFKVLNASGYIKRVKGHGTVVNHVDTIIESAPIGESLKLADIKDVLEFREMIETTQAKYAALKASEEDIREMENLLKEMKKSMDDLQTFSSADERFHLLISKMSGNNLLLAIMRNMESTINSTIRLAFQIDTNQNIKDALAAHTEILEAIKDRDAVGAEDAMRRHIVSVSARFFKDNKLGEH